MAHEYSVSRHCSHDRTYLRAAVLHVGGLLGWKAGEVIGFTEALTGRGWRHCGPEEFQLVLDEYLALGRVIQDKAARRRARNERSVKVIGGQDAITE